MLWKRRGNKALAIYFLRVMTQIINIENSKLQLSDLLALVQGGNEIIV